MLVLMRPCPGAIKLCSACVCVILGELEEVGTCQSSCMVLVVRRGCNKRPVSWYLLHTLETVLGDWV